MPPMVRFQWTLLFGSWLNMHRVKSQCGDRNTGKRTLMTEEILWVVMMMIIASTANESVL